MTSRSDPLRSGPQVETEIIFEFIDGHGVADSVLDVFIRDPVLERRGVNLHTEESYYETVLLSVANWCHQLWAPKDRNVG
jgi:hypothetical protein